MSMAVNAGAAVQLAPIFQDHMVLQRDKPVPVWGTAKPGETITVRFQNQVQTTQASSEGQWSVRLDPLRADARGAELSIEGENALRLSDVLVGEIWLASGQSNMEWPLVNTLDGPAAIAAANDPLIRFFMVPKQPAIQPNSTINGAWQKCSPSTANQFSAVAYYFARKLSSELGVPVGILQSAVGGTPAESWTSIPSLEKDPRYARLLESRNAFLAVDPKEVEETASRIEREWKAKVATLLSFPSQPEPAWFDRLPSGEGWKEIKFPAMLESQLGVETEGSFWVRTAFEVPADKAGQAAVLHLGVVDDFDFTWLNGLLIGKMDQDSHEPWRTPRLYEIPAGLLRAGTNVLVVRVIDHFLDCGFPPRPKAVFVRFASGEQIPLAGPALARLEVDLGRKPSVPSHDLSGFSGALYNGMIAPLAPFALRGAIWYQGESNVGRSAEYRRLFPQMIQDWRAAWKEDFPFYFVQLAGYGEVEPEPGESGWAEIREAQDLTLALPKTGMASALDLGESREIHPRDKATLGRRLAQAVLAGVHAKSLAASGPRFDSFTIEQGKIRVRFTELHGGLVARPLPETYVLSSDLEEFAPFPRRGPHGELEGFAIRGKNDRWVWANARIEDDTVVVWSDTVSEPSDVRYNWSDMPLGNLDNRAGLPATPFRSDSAVRAAEEKK